MAYGENVWNTDRKLGRKAVVAAATIVAVGGLMLSCGDGGGGGDSSWRHSQVNTAIPVEYPQDLAANVAPEIFAGDAAG
jgi:hypothetical protein